MRRRHRDRLIHWLANVIVTILLVMIPASIGMAIYEENPLWLFPLILPFALFMAGGP